MQSTDGRDPVGIWFFLDRVLCRRIIIFQLLSPCPDILSVCIILLRQCNIDIGQGLSVLFQRQTHRIRDPAPVVGSIFPADSTHDGILFQWIRIDDSGNLFRITVSQCRTVNRIVISKGTDIQGRPDPVFSVKQVFQNAIAEFSTAELHLYTVSVPRNGITHLPVVLLACLSDRERYVFNTAQMIRTI